MTGARLRALLLAGAGLIAAAALAIGLGTYERRTIPPRPRSERPTLLLVTSLPLVFGEQFSLQSTGSPALKALETRYRVLPISVTDEKSLAKGRLLLMAHPLAQPAEDLVALDRWVRGGGRVLLLADPALEWPSERPLGDPLRPPPMFMDTGLLAHWGLRLIPPEKPGPEKRRLGGYDVQTVSPGRLSGSCHISNDALVARCPVDKGRATVVADADFLDVDNLDSQSSHNLDGLLDELSSLERQCRS